MSTDTQREARECIHAAGRMCTDHIAVTVLNITPDELKPVRVLLDYAEGLLDGSAAARDRKNAGDRKRRTTKKAPGKKRKPKNPPAKRSSAAALGNLPT